jgi:acetyl esterase/lipase
MIQHMRIETFPLAEDKPYVTLTAYVAGTSKEMPFNEKRKAILVVPGGGYSFCSDREGEPIALTYVTAGFNAFVLTYSVSSKGDVRWPIPLIDASSAMKFIRDHAEEFHIDPDYVFVVGFSAGGHLAASLGTLWDNDEIEAFLNMEKGYNKPTGMILSYPVISGLEYAHRGSFDNILGERKDDEEARRELSLELRVDEKTVPAFIWTTATDTVVPPQNSIMFAQSLAEKGIPFEMHVYPKGGHGSSLANPIVGWGAPTPITAWVNDSIRWMKSIKIEENNG